MKRISPAGSLSRRTTLPAVVCFSLAAALAGLAFIADHTVRHSAATRLAAEIQLDLARDTTAFFREIRLAVADLLLLQQLATSAGTTASESRSATDVFIADAADLSRIRGTYDRILLLATDGTIQGQVTVTAPKSGPRDLADVRVENLNQDQATALPREDLADALRDRTLISVSRFAFLNPHATTPPDQQSLILRFATAIPNSSPADAVAIDFLPESAIAAFRHQINADRGSGKTTAGIISTDGQWIAGPATTESAHEAPPISATNPELIAAAKSAHRGYLITPSGLIVFESTFNDLAAYLPRNALLTDKSRQNLALIFFRHLPPSALAANADSNRSIVWTAFAVSLAVILPAGWIGASAWQSRRITLNTLRRNETRLREAETIAEAGSWEWWPASGEFWISAGALRVLELSKSQTPTSLEHLLQHLGSPSDASAADVVH